MEDFSLDDILKKGKGKPTKKRKKSQEPTMGQQILEAIEKCDDAMRQIHRPLTNAERERLELLVNEALDCGPAPEDVFIIDKLIDFPVKRLITEILPLPLFQW